MVRELIHDVTFLSLKARDAKSCDASVCEDLLDTLKAHSDGCVGMAANMIGEAKRIIAFYDESGKAPCYTVMRNPEIVKKSGAYKAEEGCLSLLGGPRSCVRYKNIKVKFQTEDMQVRFKSYSGFTAQIIQHEIDHTNGILI